MANADNRDAIVPVLSMMVAVAQDEERADTTGGAGDVEKRHVPLVLVWVVWAVRRPAGGGCAGRRWCCC